MVLSSLLGRENIWKKCERFDEQDCFSLDISSALQSPGKGLARAFEMLKKSENWKLDRRKCLIEKIIDGADHWPYEMQAYLSDKLLNEIEKLPATDRGLLHDKLKTRRKQLEGNVLANNIATYGTAWSCFKLAVMFGTPLRRLWSTVLFPVIVPASTVAGFSARSRVLIYGGMRALSWCCLLGAFAAKGLYDGQKYAAPFRVPLQTSGKTEVELKQSAEEIKILMKTGSQSPRYGTKDFESFRSTFTPEEEATFHMLYLKTRLISCTVGYLLGRVLAYPIALLYMRIARRAFLPSAFHGYSVAMQNDIIVTMLHFIALPVVPLYLQFVKSRNYNCATSFMWVQRMSTSPGSAESLFGNPDALPYEMALQKTRSFLLWLLDPQKTSMQDYSDDFDDDILPEVPDLSESADDVVLLPCVSGNVVNEVVPKNSQKTSDLRPSLETSLHIAGPLLDISDSSSEKLLEDSDAVQQDDTERNRIINELLSKAKEEIEVVDSIYTGKFFSQLQNENLFSHLREASIIEQEQMDSSSEWQEETSGSRHLQCALFDMGSFEGLMDTRPLQQSFFTDKPCFSGTPVKLRYNAQEFKQSF